MKTHPTPTRRKRRTPAKEHAPGLPAPEAHDVAPMRDPAAPASLRAAAMAGVQRAAGNAVVERALGQVASTMMVGQGLIERCPAVPPRPSVEERCVDMVPLEQDTVPLPTVQPGLGSDQDVIDFVRSLAACKAEHEARQAHVREVTHARRRKQAQPEFDPTSAQALIPKIVEQLTSDFVATQHSALARMGAGWQTRSRNTLRRTRRRLERLARPSRRQQTPALSNEELTVQMNEAYCLELRVMGQRLADVRRAWMVGRREEMQFETSNQTGRRLGRDFAPSREVSDAERVPIPQEMSSGGPGVAPEVAAFLEALRQREPNVRAGNYGRHGSGAFRGRGFSVDLTLDGPDAPLDERGFYGREAAVRLLLSISKIVSGMNGQWQAIYNDFSVAQRVNEETGVQNVIFVGKRDSNGRLNWHGPGPLVLHFHLDLQLPPPAPTQGQSTVDQTALPQQ